MKNKNLIIIAVLAIIFIAAAGYYYFFQKDKSLVPENTTNEQEGSSFTTLPETLDQEKFEEYFSGVPYLGSLPLGTQMGTVPIEKTTVFNSGEQLCIFLDVKKNIAAGTLATVLYDVNAKNNIRVKSVYALALEAGERLGCEELHFSKGSYEYKLYIGDVLVINSPFEVK